MASPKLVRQLGLFDSTMIMSGIVIGSGIFLTTGIMAQYLPSPGLILLAWAVGGLITLAGALTYAELGACLPEAGGQYVYLREAYGPLPGFLFGWQLFLVYMTGGIAGLAVAFAEYCGYFWAALSPENVLASGWGMSLSAGQLVAVGVIVLLSALNYLGLGLGKAIQNVFTVVKIGGLALFIVWGWAVLGGGQPAEVAVAPLEMSSGRLIMGFSMALVSVFWAFDGWNNVTFVAGEIKNPGRTLPLALIVGTLGITVVYLLVNVLYLTAVPMSELAGEVRVAERAATVLFGATGASLVSAAVIVSTFGALNGSILAGPRVYYAMARDGLFFKRMGEVHPRFLAPGFAILAQCLWASVLALSGSFEQIITFTMFVSITFWIAATSAVFTLRRKRPDLPRPYRAWGYPVVPALFIAASAGILLNTVIEKPVEALAGIGFMALGVPVYLFWRRKNTPL
jgi:APA family basic amino acid/polyamine antiporter